MKTEVGHRPKGGSSQTEVKPRQEDAIVETGEIRGAVGQPAAEIIPGGQGNEGNGNLRCPDKMRSAEEGGEHFGAEDFYDQNNPAGDGGGEIKVPFEVEAQRGFRRL